MARPAMAAWDSWEKGKKTWEKSWKKWEKYVKIMENLGKSERKTWENLAEQEKID